MSRNRLIKTDDGERFPNTVKGLLEIELHLMDRTRTKPLAANAHPRYWLVHHGREFVGQHLPDEFEQMAPQMCFMNSFKLAENDDRLHYVEGYALRDHVPLPIHHAWCVDDDDKVIDATWDDVGPRDTYLGLIFPDFDAIEEIVDTSGTYGLLYKYEARALIEGLASA